MVFKRSEYRRQFKPSSLVKNIPNYYDHVSYRNHRRELEYSHTPISWDMDNEKLEENDVVQENMVEDLSLDKLKVAEEEECLEEDEEDEDYRDVKEEEINENCDAEILDKSQEDIEKKKLAREKLSKYVSSDNQNSPDKSKILPQAKADDLDILYPKKVDEKTFVKRSEKKKSDGNKKVNSSRPKTTPVTSASSDTPRRAPFLLYGCGVSERETGKQRTHNVRSTTAVYPAALTAHRRHQKAAKKRQDADLQAALKAKRKKILLNQKMERDKASWISEYVQRYPTYDSSEYTKSWERVKRCKTVFSF